MRVLVALDDSPQSWGSFEFAIDRFADEEIVALTVGDEPGLLPSSDGSGDESAILEEAEDVADVFDVSVETAAVSGSPAGAIVA